MKTWISRFACVAVLAVTASAFALTVTQSIGLPGVDQGGNLSPELGAPVEMKININTDKWKFRAHGTGKVENLSRQRQVYKNVEINIPEVSISRSRYVVARGGKCRATAVGTVFSSSNDE